VSILTFSKAMLEKFGAVIYPELQRRATTYSHYFDTDSSGAQRDIEAWLARAITLSRGELDAIVQVEGWDARLVGNDDTMNAILWWVKRNVTYQSDFSLHSKADWWQQPSETLALRKGDCEDGAILIVALAYCAHVPVERYWLEWGEVVGGGHAYVCYLRDDDAEEVVLDWCYWFLPTLMKLRKWIGDDPNYKRVWGTAKVTL
jgi:transglutaminase-like putative cysteine protease